MSETIDDRRDCKDGCFNRPERWQKKTLPPNFEEFHMCKLCGKIIGRIVPDPTKRKLKKEYKQ